MADTMRLFIRLYEPYGVEGFYNVNNIEYFVPEAGEIHLIDGSVDSVIDTEANIEDEIKDLNVEGYEFLRFTELTYGKYHYANLDRIVLVIPETGVIWFSSGNSITVSDSESDLIDMLKNINAAVSDVQQRRPRRQ